MLLALFILAVTSPVLLFCALYVKLREPGEAVIFRQPRMGYHNRVFTIYKFRTMKSARRDKEGRELTTAQRLTRHGRIMRKLSLDELPQLFNVLRGDMSFIGPRPLLPKYLPYYTAEENRRHLVRPGISGWAQVNGRNAQSWGERLQLDVWYVDHQSLGLDMKIFFLTFLKVVKREGIGAAGRESTMPEFFGSSADYNPDQDTGGAASGTDGTPGL
jgi:sugar transferase EpsL